MSRWPCKDYFKRTCTNSFCGKWHPPECLFHKSENGCRFGEKCACVHRQVEEQPSKRAKKKMWQKCSGFAEEERASPKNRATCLGCLPSNIRQLGCVCQDMEPPKSVNTTPQMTRFRDAKVCNNWLQERIDDHRIQSDYKYKSGLKVRIQHWYDMLAWWRCTITRPTPMTTWQPWLSSTHSTSTRTLEFALSRSSCVSASSYIAHAPHGSSRESCVLHVIPSTCAHDVCGSPSPLISPFSSPFTSRTSCRTPSTSSPTWSS